MVKPTRVETNDAGHFSQAGRGVVASHPGTSEAVLVDPPRILDLQDRWRPVVPALPYAGPLDAVVPYPVTKQLFTDWCSASAKGSFCTIGIAEHITGMQLGWPLVLEWISDWFAGERRTVRVP